MGEAVKVEQAKSTIEASMGALSDGQQATGRKGSGTQKVTFAMAGRK